MKLNIHKSLGYLKFMKNNFPQNSKFQNVIENTRIGVSCIESVIGRVLYFSLLHGVLAVSK